MSVTSNLLRVEPLFEVSCEDINTTLYGQMTTNVLEKIIPPSLHSQDPHECLTQIRKLLPFVSFSSFRQVPFNLSFYLLCSFRSNAFQFFFELVTRWLVPGKRLNVELFFAADFRFPELSEEVYTVGEVLVRIENQKDLEELSLHLPIIETELRLGIVSVYHARRILEIKGLGAGEKTAMIHESIATLIKRKSRNIDWDILSEMQHFLVTCSDKFKAMHDYKYMSRLICFLYLFRRSLRQAVSQSSEKRALLVKLMRARLHKQNDVKKVLGVLVGINFLEDHEIFEERHLVKGLCSIVADSRPVEGSFFVHFVPREPLRALYIEIEKIDGCDFTNEEITKLRKELGADLRGRVERLVHPIFMPRNEEEIMRNIVTLSNQIKFVRDIPEVILSFDEHSATKLSFTVIMLRVLKGDSLSIEELFSRSNTCLEYVPERIKIVGVLRKKYEKEASVFRVHLDKGRFLREDHSVDLYKARQAVVGELTKIMGEIRDYNGGMIAKQNEQFSHLKELLGGVGKHHELLLENFFYSLTPVVMRSLLEPILLKKLFLFLLDVVEDGIFENQRYLLKFWQESEGLFVIVIAKEDGFQSDAIRAIDHLKMLGFDSAHINIKTKEKYCLGFIYRGQEEEKQARFYATIEEVLKSW